MPQVISHKLPELIVALDVDNLKLAKAFVDKLYPTVKIFKIGNQLFTAYGPKAVKMVGEKGGKVFLDLKFNDIPNTVQNASYSSTGMGGTITFASLYSYITSRLRLEQEVKDAMQYPVAMLTVHATTGMEALQGAVKGVTERAKELKITRPRIVGVTVLTSDKLGEETLRLVLERANYVKQAGLDGVVCSVHEAAAVRKACGEDFIIVTPGIRPAVSKIDDQKRIATPEEAKKAGANFIVVGRPILEAENPLKVAEAIVNSLSA